MTQRTNLRKSVAFTMRLFMVAALMLFAGYHPAQAQPLDVKGTVVSAADGLPVIGASVIEKGTSNGTVVANDGSFQIRVRRGAVLVVSAFGYATQEVEATAGPLNILLAEDDLWLEDAVVIGYGVQKKKLVTGATVQVKGDDVAKLNTVDVLGALQSQSPGVSITQNSGFLGAGFKVNIRGLGTTGDSAPLYVVDGVANGSISALNPSDIESIDVLKDAASAAIYGARAANGVILVTTKKGKAGQSNVTYDGYYGLQNLYKIPTSLNASEYMAIQDESRVMDGLEPYNWSNYIPAATLAAIADGSWNGTNWLKEIIHHNAPVTSHSVNVTGGTDRSVYSLGLGYMRQDATMGVPSAIPQLRRYNLRVNNEYSVFKKNNLDILKVGETLNYRYSETDGSFATGGIYWNGVHNMLVMSTLQYAYDEDGSYHVRKDGDGYNWDTANGASKNPIAYMDYNANQNRS